MSASNQIPARAGDPGCGGSAGDGATVPHRMSGVSPGNFPPSSDMDIPNPNAVGEAAHDVVPTRSGGLFTGRASGTGIPLAERVALSERRTALIREIWTQPIHRDEVRQRINALGGPPLSAEGIRQLAKRAGVRRGNEGRVVGASGVPKAVKRHNSPTARAMRQIALTEPPSADQPSGIPAKRLLAADLIRKAGKDVSIFSVAGRTGLEPWQVANVIGCVRHGWAIV